MLCKIAVSFYVLSWADSTQGLHHQEVCYWCLAWPKEQCSHVLWIISKKYLYYLLAYCGHTDLRLGYLLFTTETSGSKCFLLFIISFQNSWVCLRSACGFIWKSCFSVSCYQNIQPYRILELEYVICSTIFFPFLKAIHYIFKTLF